MRAVCLTNSETRKHVEEYLASGTLPPSEDVEMTSCDNVSKEKMIVKDTEEMDIVEDNSVNASQSQTDNCDDIVIGLENINTSTKQKKVKDVDQESDKSFSVPVPKKRKIAKKPKTVNSKVYSFDLLS